MPRSSFTSSHLEQFGLVKSFQSLDPFGELLKGCAGGAAAAGARRDLGKKGADAEGLQELHRGELRLPRLERLVNGLGVL